MALVQIIGPEEVLRELVTVPGLEVVGSSGEPRGEGRWEVCAYVSDAAIEVARAKGAEVLVVVSTEDYVAHRQEVADAIARGRAERGED